MPQDIPPPALEAGGTPGLTPEQASTLARSIAEWHRKGKQRKRQRDLLAEKLLLHVDGEGDAQWMDIVGGSRLRIQPNLDGGIRCSTNLLRPILSNFVSYQTAIPYRVLADARSDRASAIKARVDSVYANHVIQDQRLNELYADALNIAACYGFCPIFGGWREDANGEAYEPIYEQNKGVDQLRPGKIDCWLGDPWCMVFNTGATRRSITRTTYERILPLEMLQGAIARAAFNQQVDPEKLKGVTSLPSASRFQMIARKWAGSFGPHGNAVLTSAHDNEETIALVCREVVPGIDPDYPDGRLTIIALSGVAEMETNIGTPVLLHDGPLPGRRFSFVRLYSDMRTDDPYGYPWLTPLDELQVRRNNYETLLANGGQRSAYPARVDGPGGIDAAVDAYMPDAVLEAVNPQFKPYFLEYPTQWMASVRSLLQDTEAQMFRIGGWQAASRGESNAGDPAKKVELLQQADDTVHGPINRALQGTLVEYLQLIHMITRENSGPFPIAVRSAGADFGYLASEYITADQMSEEPPQFMVTNGFGSTKESIAQQLLQMVAMQGADGEPVLRTKHLRKQYPDNSIWPNETDPEDVKKRRAQAINYKIREAVRQMRQQGFDENAQVAQMPPDWQAQQKAQLLQQAAMQIATALDADEPIERSDDLQVNLDTLDEIVQDVDEDKLVRAVARLRQDQNYQQQAAIYAQQTQVDPNTGAPASDSAQGQAATQPGAPLQPQAA